MRILGKASLALLIVMGLFAQYRGGSSGASPKLIGNFGGVVFPRGPLVVPGWQRGFGSAFPAGGSGAVIPNRTTGTGLVGGFVVRGAGPGVVYAFPVFVGGCYDISCLNPAEQPVGQGPPGPDGVAANPPAAAPVLISPWDGGDAQASGEQSGLGAYQSDPTEPVEESAAPPEPAQYLLAFKDRTIYATPAYWVDGDTIHYFTAGNKHNQASVSLIDRELTERLNAESGVEVDLPAAK
ncbi:MAG: hypothetical protein ABSF25_04440 [Bryobacteraceae bacterium]|jgi:hypothetical protein